MIMLPKLIESFGVELQKEETQEYINNIISPYFSKYKYYLHLITFMIFMIFIGTFYNTIILRRIYNQTIKVS